MCRHVRTRDRGMEAGMWVMWWSVAVVLSAVALRVSFMLDVVQSGVGIGLQNMVAGRGCVGVSVVRLQSSLYVFFGRWFVW